MKKILFKGGTTNIGGVEKIQIEYINFLIEQNYDVKVIIENDYGKENVLEKYIHTQVQYLKDTSYTQKLNFLQEQRKNNLLAKIKYLFSRSREKNFLRNKIIRIYQEFQPDLVIDFDASLTKMICRLQQSKNLVWIHSSVSHWKRTPKKTARFLRRLEAYDKVVSICQEMEKEVVQLNPLLEKNSVYLYNPINFEKILQLSTEETTEIEKQEMKEKFLLSVARFDCIPKDFETLFQAFDYAKEQGYSGKLYLLGDGKDRNIVEELRLKTKYREDIVLLGWKENPYSWIKAADKLILSSRYEGFPTILLEGLVLEKEVLSSNCKTGPKEILAEGRGKLFEIGDIETLGKYILEMNSEKMISLEDFQSSAIFKKLLNILEEI